MNKFRSSIVAATSAAIIIIGGIAPLRGATGLDLGFGASGKVVYNAAADVAGASSTAFGIAIHPATGKIYACGFGRLATSSFTGISVTRFNADGSPDPTFGSNGKQLIAFQSGGNDVNARGNGLIVLADGSVIVAGGVSTFGVVTKLTNAGLLDTTFGTNGSTISNFGGSSASLNAIVAQTDGTFFAGGSAGGNFVVAKFTATGGLDTTFGSGGSTKTAFVGTDVAAGIALQSDGKIVLAGRAANDCALARYNINGTPDTAFGVGGKVTSNFVPGNPDAINEVLIQADGKILGVGIAAPTGLERHLLVRYNTNGTLDTTYGTNGVAGSYFGNSQEFLYGAKLLASGKVVVVGFIGRNATIARYNADGSPDRGFMCGGFGWVYFNNIPTFGYFYDVAIQPDGKVVAVGQGNSPSIPTNGFAFARFNVSDTPTQCAANDFDHDGISDLSVIRPNAGGTSAWYRKLSTGANNAFEYAAVIPFGLSTDKYTPADFDGDGIPDTAIFRDGTWWIYRSSDRTVTTTQFGTSGDLPVPADQDGDGKADLCIFRPSTGTFWRLNSSNSQIVVTQFGSNGDIPMIGDYDGDYKIDLAVFRPSVGVWYVLRSSDGQVRQDQFGLNGDVPVAGDFNGDGKSDLAVYRPANGVWYVARPAGVPSQNFDATPFGISGDKPVPADYDGDGKTDIAVYRAGEWWTLLRSSGSATVEKFGLPTDVPVPAAYLP